MAYRYDAPRIPFSFIQRRLFSLAGLGLVIYLIEHLLTNSQAALFVGAHGSGFVNAVNAIRELPYLPVIELLLVAAPFILHGMLGLRYLWTGEQNVFSSDGSTPSLGQYRRNWAYTIQRLTAWILLFGIIAHVVHMRWLRYPASAQVGTEHAYMIDLSRDEGLDTLANRLGFKLYDEQQVRALTLEQEQRATTSVAGDASTDLIAE